MRTIAASIDGLAGAISRRSFLASLFTFAAPRVPLIASPIPLSGRVYLPALSGMVYLPAGTYWLRAPLVLAPDAILSGAAR